jgi:glucose/arabinose dehydrogenase
MRLLLVFLFSAVFITSCSSAIETLPATAPSLPVPVIESTFTPQPVQPVPADTTTPFSTPTPLPLPAAVSFPDPNAYAWMPFVAGLYLPVDIRNAGDGSGRLFVVERPGRIRIVKDGLLFQDPFLDISDRVGSKGSEQGLLGLAFHPNYETNGFFYVNYTDRNGDTVISRFSVGPDSNRADPGSELRMLGVPQPYANHNGGAVAFGPDGYLYLGLGDGGSQGDPNGNGQSLNSLLGKILRLDVDHDVPYSIPADNPYAASGEVYQEIWASGLRNPWRFSFDPASGDLYIGDVGQNDWEEIDIDPAGVGGLNFGWNSYEGNHPYAGSASSAAFAFPVAEYNHNMGCSVTGGVVSRGANLPAWNGIYLYGDFCTGFVWGLLTQGGSWQSQLLFQTGLGLSTFGVDEAGDVYVADYRSGTIYRLASR